ncbi:Gp138 family membrane-puncturing spike protein [Bosea sp. UNC402CLCol]|uniref:Gp138 family membrane-puncturing spike protein n=1 Tax=Bosea sp. UNC402CLCol TaxID=1510531 RepID=UPI000690E5CB|nr:Gp138 family membrane-puncturing spike protein [Bosea sp. UNC402CLCol]
MDLRQRVDDPEENLRAAIEQHISRIQTSAPARVLAFDPGGAGKAPSVKLQIGIKSFVKQEDGSQKAIDLPVLQDVPVHYPGGGGMNITFPLKVGDEGMVNFTSRSPDTWQQSGGEQVPADASMHSLSNGYFTPGLKSNPNAIDGISTSSTEIRSDDGKTKISMSGAGGVGISTDKQVGISAANGVSIGGGAGETAITGTVRINGELIVNDIVFSTHKHSGVQPGGGNSAGPTN